MEGQGGSGRKEERGNYGHVLLCLCLPFLFTSFTQQYAFKNNLYYYVWNVNF